MEFPYAPWAPCRHAHSLCHYRRLAVTFCDWLLSLGTVFSRFMHAIAGVITSVLFMAGEYSIARQPNHSLSTCGWTFVVLPFGSCVQVSVWIYDFISLG